MPVSNSRNMKASPGSGGGLRMLYRLGPYLAPYRLAMAGAGVALLVAGVTVLTIVGGLRYVIDKGFMGADPAMLDQTLFRLLIAIVILAIATYSRYSLVTWLGERVVADLRRAMYDHILKLSPAYFEVTRAGDVLSRMTSDIGILQTVIASSISVTLRNGVLLIGGVLMMMTTSPKLTGFVVLGIPIVVAPIIFFGRRVRRLSRAAQERTSDLIATSEETIYGIRTVQAFSHEELSHREFAAQSDAVVNAAIRHIRMRAWLTAMVIFLVFSAIGVVLWIGGHDVLNHTITAGQLSAFVGYAALAAGATGVISESMGDLNRAAGATERIFDLLAEKPSVAPPLTSIPLPAPRGELEFDHVTFSYPARPDILPCTTFHSVRRRANVSRSSAPAVPARPPSSNSPCAFTIRRWARSASTASISRPPIRAMFAPASAWCRRNR